MIRLEQNQADWETYQAAEVQKASELAAIKPESARLLDNFAIPICHFEFVSGAWRLVFDAQNLPSENWPLITEFIAYWTAEVESP